MDDCSAALSALLPHAVPLVAKGTEHQNQNQPQPSHVRFLFGLRHPFGGLSKDRLGFLACPWCAEHAVGQRCTSGRANGIVVIREGEIRLSASLGTLFIAFLVLPELFFFLAALVFQ
ncbi:MAG: hypothetical protein CVU36_12330 [Betaproteobacteria bacterium HGW-Betaproteobacteria-9]|nr:MAG: hypothetical protein CVU36_12330 [Betaproteobacteria bacterium HGW-Betaproteobacteria-9]